MAQGRQEAATTAPTGQGRSAGDQDYATAGAELVDDPADIFGRADMVVKVKEPQASERAQLREGQVLLTYLHLAPDADQTADLVASGATCIAYETVTDASGRLPLLAPMSQVAGRMSVQAGAHALESAPGGAGVLLGGVPGVHSGRVVVIGGGVVGENAIEMGAVPRTSTHALNNATLPFVLTLADLGPTEAMRRDPHLRNGLNVALGKVTEPAVAEALGYEHHDASTVLDQLS